MSSNSRKNRKSTSHTVDFQEYFDRIEAWSDTPEWKQLKFAGKVRALLHRVLSPDVQAQEQKVAAIRRFVQAISQGQRPTEPDCILVAHFLDLDIEVLYALVAKVVEESERQREQS